MKFPSIKTLAEGFLSTIKRYPFEFVFALIGTIAGTVEVELRHLNRVHEGWLMRGVMTANLGLLLSLSATLFTQSREMTKQSRRIIKVIAAIFAASLIFIIDPTAREADYIRFFLLSLSFHLLVAFAAFTGKGQVNGFWQFNRTLFLRFLLSVQFGVALFLGIAVAIGATNFLFNFKFEWDTYAILWIWIVGIFTTTIFLAGIPLTQSLDADLSYPKGLKNFAQYVLIPLSTIYLLILLAYELKILIQWSLPKGLVSNLILGYAVFGILSLLLVYPVREQAENKWIKTYARSFYFFLIPLLGLLFVAVGARVFKYGITEWRYFLLALACWLLFISVYFLAFKKQNIKLIPISLCILPLLSVYGPQSAFSVSMYSQKRIIVKFFEKYNAIRNGKFTVIDSTKVSIKDGSHAVAALQYFISKYDLSALQPYFYKDMAIVSDSLEHLRHKNFNPSDSEYELKQIKYEWAKHRLGLSHFEPYNSSNNELEKITDHYEFSEKSKIRNIKDYDFSYSPGYMIDSLTDELGDLQLNHTTLDSRICILKINKESFRFDANDIIQKLMKDPKKLAAYKSRLAADVYSDVYRIPSDSLSLSRKNNNFEVKLQVENVRISAPKGKQPQFMFITFTYYIKRR